MTIGELKEVAKQLELKDDTEIKVLVPDYLLGARSELVSYYDYDTERDVLTLTI